MKFLRKLFYLVIVLAMAGVGILFAVQNETPVPLDLVIYNLPPRSIALWVLSAFALGGVLGMLASSLLILRTRASLNASERQLNRTREEVSKLRTNTPALPDAQAG